MDSQSNPLLFLYRVIFFSAISRKSIINLATKELISQ